MSSDWIKMRTDLYRDPKVCLLADRLMDMKGDLAAYVRQNTHCDMAVTRNVMRNVTVGALVTVWGVTRHRGKRYENDLIIHGASVSIIDDIADLPGFGEAMQHVGWVVQTEDGLKFPNFFEDYNSDPSVSTREKNAERQRRYREKHNALRNVTPPLRNGIEKSRVEQRKTAAAATVGIRGNPGESKDPDGSATAVDPERLQALAEVGIGEPKRSALAKMNLSLKDIARIAREVKDKGGKTGLLVIKLEEHANAPPPPPDVTAIRVQQTREMLYGKQDHAKKK